MFILDITDRRILATISKKGAHASYLARKLAIPRTTIAYRLNILSHNNLVTKESVGKKVVWHIPLYKTHDKSLVSIYKGIHFLDCYAFFQTLKKNSIVYVIQGHRAAIAEQKHIPEEVITKVHTVVKRRGIVLKTMANKKILDEFKHFSKKLYKSHIGRPLNVKLLDNRFLSAGEIFVCTSQISIINPDKKIGVIIKEKNIVEMFYDLMVLLFHISEKLDNFDLNAHLVKNLE